jgi:hypothetical protein
MSDSAWSNDSVPPEQLLTLLAEPEDSKNILLLLNLVSGHPLLLYRIDRAWRTFNSPLVLYSNLKESSQRLEWHLWRIYRARNLLVHHGMEPRFIPQLANHLQQYFSWTLSRILHGLTFGPEWRATDSWTFWKSKSDHVLRSLKTNAKMLVVGICFPKNFRPAIFRFGLIDKENSFTKCLTPRPGSPEQHRLPLLLQSHCF